MTEEASEGSDFFVVKNIHNIHHLKIDVVKFNGTNNIGLWRCKVLDELNAQNLEDSLDLQEKLSEMEENVWKKMNRIACGVIRSSSSQDVKYDVMNVTSKKKSWEILASKYLMKSVENRLHLKRRLYRFQLNWRFPLVITSTTTCSFSRMWV